MSDSKSRSGDRSLSKDRSQSGNTSKIRYESIKKDLRSKSERVVALGRSSWIVASKLVVNKINK